MVRPCLIKETLYIPDAPTEVRILLESSNLYMIDWKYKKALEALNEAHQLWLKIEGKKELKNELELYF